MGKPQSKEVVIAQNAAGGVNAADVAQLHQNQSVTNFILGAMLVILTIGVWFGVYKLYKRCHVDWMRAEIARSAFRRSGPRRDPRSKESNIESV
ncbi:hypothetical protein HF086_009350 [Spodoptera exigua]|uniref:Uncharacterized protein n=1 Tax=Spodoptera exigua TaxID=7107 RepID=A0A922SGN8_SPOEX|nr:hypothetical protein HF086_017368 [Spodoptera exigua]KAH9628441.1 hypothetical protein HF086_015971 [Spodoptera exigua]KAH9635134.1 hypothetical protein HF086_000855 [Spodoptera exigua]KAH9637682.1 hypothetical protein HF086_009350 [Spodoptera exigua]